MRALGLFCLWLLLSAGATSAFTPPQESLFLGGARPINVYIFVGDSNTYGAAQDNQTLSYSANALVLALNQNGAINQYAPNTNNNGTNYTPATAGVTGVEYSTTTDHGGPETGFAQAQLAAVATIGLFKLSTSGGTAGFFSGEDSTACWNASTGTAAQNAVTKILAGLAALRVRGYTPKIKLITIGFGTNDAAHDDATSAFQTSMMAMMTYFKANLPWISGFSKFVLTRPPASVIPNMATIRAAILTLATGTDTGWIDTDYSTVNASPNQVHYDQAGLILNGNNAYTMLAFGVSPSYVLNSYPVLSGNTTNWTTPTGVLSVTANGLKVAYNGSAFASAYQAVSVISGSSSTFSVQFTKTTDNASIYLGTTNGGNDIVNANVSASGTYSYSFTPAVSTVYITLYDGGSGTNFTEFNNITIKSQFWTPGS